MRNVLKFRIYDVNIEDWVYVFRMCNVFTFFFIFKLSILGVVSHHAIFYDFTIKNHIYIYIF